MATTKHGSYTITTLKHGSYTIANGYNGSYLVFSASTASWHTVWSGITSLSTSSTTITSSVSSSATQIRVTYDVDLYDVSTYEYVTTASSGQTATFNKGSSYQETVGQDAYVGYTTFTVASSGTNVTGVINDYEEGGMYFCVVAVTKVEAYY